MPRITDDMHINPRTTVAELTSEFEGTDFDPIEPDKDHWICDFCSTGVPYSANARVADYFADDILSHNHPYSSQIHANRPLIPLASYCEDCSTRRLLFPCHGFAEARVMYNLGKDRIVRDVDVTDVSPRDDGIPWNPKDVSNAITQAPFEQMLELGGNQHLWGPENMVTFFLSSIGGIDIRELVQWDGEIDNDVLGRARIEYDRFMHKMIRASDGPGRTNRKAFRDHVRGDDE